MLLLENTTVKRQSQIKPTVKPIIKTTDETGDTKIFAHCELCAAHAAGSKSCLRGLGWGIYEKVQFCPFHEAMI